MSQKKTSKKNRKCINIRARVLFSFRTRGGELLTTREHDLTKTEGWP